MAPLRVVSVGLTQALFGMTGGASAQIPLPKVVVDPAGAMAGEYKLDPHHASVTVKLAHLGLSRHTVRFDQIEGHFAYLPGRATR